VVAIDARRVNGGFEVFVAGGRIPTGRDALQWSREAADRGAGEILLTSMDRDGTQAGFDCELVQIIADAVSIPVIASGGAGSARDFIDVFRNGRADAALAASIFHFGIENIGQLKRELRAANVPVAVSMGNDAAFGPQIDGLLGMTFLARFDVRLANGALELKPRGLN